MSVGLEIHDAASTGDFDSLEEYLRSGKFDVNLKDEEWNNRTALHWACAKGYVECIRLLLDFGAVGTARTDTGWTPAHFAAETGKLTALRALHNANVSVGAKDKYGDTPKRIAEIYGHSECSEFLERVTFWGIISPYRKVYIQDQTACSVQSDLGSTLSAKVRRKNRVKKVFKLKTSTP